MISNIIIIFFEEKRIQVYFYGFFENLDNPNIHGWIIIGTFTVSVLVQATNNTKTQSSYWSSCLCPNPSQ